MQHTASPVKRSIPLTRQQYRALLKIVFLGDWFANSSAMGEEEEDPEISSIRKYIYSFAAEFGARDWIDYDTEFQDYFSTPEMEEGLMDVIQDYNEDQFWEELLFRLARRDLLRIYDEETVMQMDPQERISREGPFLDLYDEEIDQHGIERLVVDTTL